MFNVLLARWAGGWMERTRPGSVSFVGRMEGYLSLGSTNTLDEAIRLTDAQLLEFARIRTQTDLAILPADNSDTPYLGFGVGDAIMVDAVGHRVLGMTVTEDPATGEAMFAPQLNRDLVLDPDARAVQWVRKMIPGTLGGRSRIAQPHITPYANVGLVPIGIESGGPIVCITETFDEPDSATIGPVLTWETVADTGGYTGEAYVHNAKLAAKNIGASPPFGLQFQARSLDDVGDPNMVTTARLATVTAETDRQWINVVCRVPPIGYGPASGYADAANMGYALVLYREDGVAGGAWTAGVYFTGSGIYYDVAANTSHTYPFAQQTTLGGLAAGDVLSVSAVGSGLGTVVTGFVNGVQVATATVGAGFVGTNFPSIIDPFSNPALGVQSQGSPPIPPNPGVTEYGLAFDLMQACPLP